MNLYGGGGVTSSIGSGGGGVASLLSPPPWYPSSSSLLQVYYANRSGQSSEIQSHKKSEQLNWGIDEKRAQCKRSWLSVSRWQLHIIVFNRLKRVHGDKRLLWVVHFTSVQWCDEGDQKGPRHLHDPPWTEEGVVVCYKAAGGMRHLDNMTGMSPFWDEWRPILDDSLINYSYE